MAPEINSLVGFNVLLLLDQIKKRHGYKKLIDLKIRKWIELELVNARSSKIISGRGCRGGEKFFQASFQLFKDS